MSSAGTFYKVIEQYSFQPHRYSLQSKLAVPSWKKMSNIVLKVSEQYRYSLKSKWVLEVLYNVYLHRIQNFLNTH